jgi:small subunit ribosomal protein S8
MPVNDPIADLLTRIRNAQHARRTECVAPWSKIKQSICELLKAEGFVADVSVSGEGIEKQITVTFLDDRPNLQLKRISSPGGRKYVSANGFRSSLHGSSVAIVSTSSGLLTHKEAKKRNIGGEILCTIS